MKKKVFPFFVSISMLASCSSTSIKKANQAIYADVLRNEGNRYQYIGETVTRVYVERIEYSHAFRLDWGMSSNYVVYWFPKEAVGADLQKALRANKVFMHNELMKFLQQKGRRDSSLGDVPPKSVNDGE